MRRGSKMIVYLPWIICGLGAMFYAYEYFLRISPSVMQDNLMRHYNISEGQFGNLDAFYYYIYTPMQLVAGLLMDRYGPRRLLTIATLCCVIGTLLFAMTQYLMVAQLGRFLIGFGSAFAFVGVMKLATIWLPRKYFAMFSGIATALGMVGAILGNVALTALVNTIGWQQTTYLSALLGIILALLIGTVVRDEKSWERKKATIINSVSFKEAFQGLLTIIKTPQMWVIGLIGGIYFMPSSAFAEIYSNQYLENVHGLSPEIAAIGTSLIFAGWAIGGPFYGFISDRIKRRNLPLMITGFSAAVVMSAILFLPHPHFYTLFALLFLLGLCSSGEIIVFAVGRELGPARLAGSSIAFTNMAVMLSGVILEPLIGYMLDYVWNGKMVNNIQIFNNSNYKFALAIIPIALVVGGLLSAFVLKETHCKQKVHNVRKV